MLRVGIVGLPNVGKSTLFNALTKRNVPADNFPFCTVEPNSAIISVPDERLYRLSVAMDCPKLMPSTIEFVDIAGLVRGAHTGIGLGNEFLAYIRTVDIIVHIVRAFRDPKIVNVEETVDPMRDIRIIDEELAMADSALVDKHRISVKSRMRNTTDKDASLLFTGLDKLWRVMREKGSSVRDAGLSSDEWERLSVFGFLVLKPTLVVVNVGEEGPFDKDEWTERLERPCLSLCIRGEQELGDIEDPSERALFRESLGISGAIDDVIRGCVETLDLITFYTFGKGVTRAWPVRIGTSALAAAGLIHTDFLETFVKAQIFSLEELCAEGERKLRDRGRFQTVGREYLMRDGDVLWVVASP